MIESRMTRWAKKNAQRIFVGNPEGKRPQATTEKWLCE
jgi:hypothetical protein